MRKVILKDVLIIKNTYYMNLKKITRYKELRNEVW